MQLFSLDTLTKEREESNTLFHRMAAHELSSIFLRLDRFEGRAEVIFGGKFKKWSYLRVIGSFRVPPSNGFL